MRILFITHTNGIGGANFSMLQLIEELRSNQKVVPIVVCPPMSHTPSTMSIVKQCEERGIDCHSLPIVWFKQRGKISLVMKARIIFAWFRWTIYLLLKLRNVDFDMVHSNASVIDAGAYLSMARGVPHVWHLREFGFEDFQLKSVLGERYERWIYNKCTRAIAISKAIEEKFKPYLGNRIKLIYNGVVTREDSFSATHDNEATTFCIVGRIESNKNQLEVVKACALLKKQTSKPFKLLIVGKGNLTYTDALKKCIEDNCLEQNVMFTGERTDVPQILKTCDVGIMSSVSEAFGRVTVEYMMQNLAVIASDTGANPEIVIHGETGLLYELGNVNQLAERMRLLLDNKEFLVKMAAKGKQYAEEHFCSVRNSDEVFKLYKTIQESQ